MRTEPDIESADRFIGRLQQLQSAKGLSDIQFANRYKKHVGSHRTWERLLNRDWANVNLGTWLPRLRAFVATLDGAAAQQEIFSTLPIVLAASALYQQLQSQENDRRCAILIGVQGTGKTLALRHVQRENKLAPIFLSANETWKDSRMRIAVALAGAVNASVASSASQTFQNALDCLKENPATFLIDEAHEGGVLLMKLVKTIINETGTRVMLSIYPTAWTRLLNGASDAYAEAQQLLRRTIRPIKTDWQMGIGIKDLDAWSKAVKLPALASCADEILPAIKRHGNFSLLADAYERAEFVAAETDQPFNHSLVIDQIKQLAQ